MDKESYQPMTIGHVAIEGIKGELSSPFLLDLLLEKGRAYFFQKWRVFRERKCNFSLDFPAFGPLVCIRPRSKVVLHGKGYAWASVLGVLTTSRGRGLLLLGYFRF